MNYEAERLILIGMMEMVCEQQLVVGVQPSLTEAIKCLTHFPIFPEAYEVAHSLCWLANCLTPESFERTHLGTERAIRLQHDRLVSAILRS